MNKLKPCPFCGGEAKFVFQPKYFGPYREAGIWCKNRKCLIHVWHRFDNSISDEKVKERLTKLWNNRSQMRGKWLDGEHFEDPYLRKYRCSVCGNAVQTIEFNAEQNTVRFTSGKSNYCPNCGAKMEGEYDRQPETV